MIKKPRIWINLIELSTIYVYALLIIYLILLFFVIYDPTIVDKIIYSNVFIGSAYGAVIAGIIHLINKYYFKDLSYYSTKNNQSNKNL